MNLTVLPSSNGPLTLFLSPIHSSMGGDCSQMKTRSGQPAPQSSFLIIGERLSETFRLATAFGIKQTVACPLCARRGRSSSEARLLAAAGAYNDTPSLSPSTDQNVMPFSNSTKSTASSVGSEIARQKAVTLTGFHSSKP